VILIKEKYNFDDLVEIMALLRSEKGCPWDKEQNHESLKKYLLEETYEVLDAIDKKNKDMLCEELGDVLLQVVFHSQIAKEEGWFSIDDVITAICKKIISRHTHVFGNETAKNADEVVKNWENIKKIEKGIETQTEVLKAIPQNLPALTRSCKVQQKAAQVGFDWNNVDDVFKKVYEEIEELKEAYQSNDKEKINEEVGDSFFALVNLARFLNVEPELALTNTIRKFIERFEYIEKGSLKAGMEIEKMTLAEMDKLWDEAKRSFKKQSN